MAKVAIRNKRTGEVRYVEQSELTGYGFNPDASGTTQTSSLDPSNAVVEDTSYAPEEQEARKGIIQSLVEPFANTAKNILGAPIEGARALYLNKDNAELDKNTQAQIALGKRIQAEKDPTKRKALMEEGRRLAGEGEKSRAKSQRMSDFKNPFLSEEDMKRASDDPRKYVTDQVKDSVEVASYGVPFGKGSNFYTKAVLPGMGVGAMQGVSKDDASVDSVVADTLIGGATGGLIHGASTVLPKIGGAIVRGTGRVVERTGENVGMRALRLSPNQITKIEERWGEKVPAILERNGVFGRNADEIKELAIDPLQSKFDDIARKSGVQVPKSAIDAKYLEKIDALLQAGDTDSIKLAEKLLQEYDSISKVLGEVNDIATITEKRMLYSNKVKNWTDLLDSGKNEISADVFREVAQEATEKAGLPGLKELGIELGKLRTVQRNAAIKENLGKGSLPLGLTNLLGVIAGTSGGGIAGGATALGATILANNPATMRVYARLSQGAGRGLQKAGSTGATSKLEGGGNVAKNIGVRAPLVFGGSPDSNNNQNANGESIQHDANGNIIAPQMQQTASEPLTGDSPMPSLTGHTPEKLYAAYIQATNDGEKTAASQLYKMWEDETAHQETAKEKGKSMSAAARKDYEKANSGLRAVERLEADLSRDPNVLLKRLNPLDQGGRAAGADITSIIDLIGYFRTGATITPDQRKDYQYMFPTIFDSTETRQRKLQAIKEELEGYQMIGESSPDVVVTPDSSMPAISY